MRIRIIAAILAGVLVFVAGCTGNADRSTGESAVNGKPRDAAKTRAPKKPPNPFAHQIPPFATAPDPVPTALPDDGVHAPVLRRVPTDQPVAFITIDDGNVRLPDGATVLRAPHTPASAFLISRVAAEDPEFFRQLQRDGMPIQAHSVNHIALRGLSYDRQKAEICGSADELAGLFGTRPTLFRPPYGEYDKTTLRAARDCGMRAVLHWSESVKDGNVYYQTPEKKIKAGDIMLLHFREPIVGDLLAALRAIYDSGLTPALLEDYVQ